MEGTIPLSATRTYSIGENNIIKHRRVQECYRARRIQWFEHERGQVTPCNLESHEDTGAPMDVT